MKIAIFQSKGWEQEYLKNALSQKNIEADFYPESLSKSKLPDKNDYDAISVFVGSLVDKEVIDYFPNLKLITTRSTGFDHINKVYAKEKNIALEYVPFYGENTVAEFAMGLILTLSRKLYLGIDRIKETGEFSFDGLEGFDLKGKTLGVVGAGRIGQHVIKMAKGFDMNIIAYDRTLKPELAKELGFEYKTFDEVLGQSDIITLHLFYAPETHHIINKENISKIKKGAYLINTARGPIVDTEALVLALEKGILAGAGLDVLEEEGTLKDEQGYWMRDADDDAKDINMKTLLQNHVLFKMPNVVVTPHNAFNTREAIIRILDTDILNITSFVETGKVINPIS
ncbi:MAG: NAD(P)-dependent oxidoreductase [Candidatus Paceibacterota bacterium]|jgi:D-lactate dehydrogenase